MPSFTRAANLNGKINHACIGVGGMMGFNDLQNFKSHPKTKIVAICDVDRDNLERAAKEVPDARKYLDWREMFAKEGDKIDSVNVTVPDHMHFPIAITAVRAGKHVYCQKPLCHDVAEVRALTEATRKADVRTQLGTQAASGFGDRLGIHYVREGLIGKVKHVYLCSNRPGAIDAYRLMGPRPSAEQSRLGSLDGHRARASLRTGYLPPEHLARLAGLRDRLVRRYWLPRLRCHLESARSDRSEIGEGQGAGIVEEFAGTPRRNLAAK
jgi:hypothetical protein